MQFVPRSTFDDIGDAGGEHAGIAGQFFVYDIGNFVRGEPQLAFGGEIDEPGDLGPFDHVHDAKTHLVAAIGGARHRTDDHGFGATRLPLRIVDLLRFVGHRIHAARIDGFEQAAAREIGNDHRRDALLESVFGTERHDGHRNLIGAGADNFDGQ